MKVDFNKKLVSLKGKELKAKDSKGKLVPMTLGDACAEGLLVVLETDNKEGGQSKYTRWKLAGRIINSKVAIEIKVEDMALIKERVGKMYGAVVVGPVFDLIEEPQKETSKNGKTE